MDKVFVDSLKENFLHNDVETVLNILHAMQINLERTAGKNKLPIPDEAIQIGSIHDLLDVFFKELF